MASRKQPQQEVLESVYSVIALVFMLVACVELGAAASDVDVYRLIQYDISGVPFRSHPSMLKHRAASMHFVKLFVRDISTRLQIGGVEFKTKVVEPLLQPFLTTRNPSF